MALVRLLVDNLTLTAADVNPAAKGQETMPNRYQDIYPSPPLINSEFAVVMVMDALATILAWR